jgi:predicted nucleic acid-binding protein
VKFFVDSSVLVAAFIPGHVHHDRSFSVFASADTKTAACAVHSLAELYATITRLPYKHRATAHQALTFVEAVQERFRLLALDSQEYLDSIRQASDRNVVGGTLYDAVIAACAVKARADTLYTWNVGHFLLLGDEISKRVRTP